MNSSLNSRQELQESGLVVQGESLVYILSIKEKEVKNDSGDGNKERMEEKYLEHNKDDSRKKILTVIEKNDGDKYTQEYKRNKLKKMNERRVAHKSDGVWNSIQQVEMR